MARPDRPPTPRLALTLVLLLALMAGTPAPAQPPAPPPDPAPTVQPRGSILFVLPNAPLHVLLLRGHLDLDYAAELVAQGFEIDYCTSEDFLDGTRSAADYNVIVLQIEPGASSNGTNRLLPGYTPEQLWTLVEAHLHGGGGLLLVPTELNLGYQQMPFLAGKLGLDFPFDVIEERTPERHGRLPRASHGGELAYTENVARPAEAARLDGGAALVDGVRRIWYPVDLLYNASTTGPLAFPDPDWVPLLRGSDTAFARNARRQGFKWLDKPQRSESHHLPDGFAYTEQSPTFGAARELDRGRVVVLNVWRNFHFGAGTKWLFNRELLDGTLVDDGGEAHRNDLGLFLRNSFTWLAAPSLAAGRNAYKTDPALLQPFSVNAQGLGEVTHTPASIAAKNSAFDRATGLFRGLIGLRSTFGGGRVTPEEFARWAVDAGVDFLVFLEEYSAIRGGYDAFRTELDRLNERYCRTPAECRLRLIGGYSMPHNLGGRAFFFGDLHERDLAPAKFVENGTLLRQIGCDASGACSAARYDNALAGEISGWFYATHQRADRQSGFALFTTEATRRGLKIADLRMTSAAAVLYFAERGGRLEKIDDATEQYLRSTEGSLPPAPIAIAEITTRDGFQAAVAGGTGMTWVRAPSRAKVMEPLSWGNANTQNHTVASAGPVVELWTRGQATLTYAAEEGIPGRSLQPLDIRVRSAAGLKSVTVYHGRRVFRRYLPGGAELCEQTLLVSAALQRSLSLVAEDVDGRVAVAAAATTRKEGSQHIVFCSDHLNDCQGSRLFRGPAFAGGVPGLRVIPMPQGVGGFSWDGGPAAGAGHLSLFVSPLVDVRLADGSIRKIRAVDYNQLPQVIGADEGVVSLGSDLEEVFVDGIPTRSAALVFGPKEPADLLAFHHQVRLFTPRSVAPEPFFVAWYPQRKGATASLFRGRIEALAAASVTKVQIVSWSPDERTVEPDSKLVFWSSTQGLRTFTRRSTDPTDPQGATFDVRTGEWFAAYSERGDHVTQVIVNRGTPWKVQVGRSSLGITLDLGTAPLTLHAGDEITYEHLGFAFSIDETLVTPEAIEAAVEFLRKLHVQRWQGRQLDDEMGLVDLEINDLGAGFRVPRAADAATLVPVRVNGLNPNWSVGLWTTKGYTASSYYAAGPRYRPLAVDPEGRAHFPVYLAQADYEVWAGHPVASPNRELEIQVTQVARNPELWWVSVNNPLDQDFVDGQLLQSRPLPGLKFGERRVTIPAGGSIAFWCDEANGCVQK